MHRANAMLKLRAKTSAGFIRIFTILDFQADEVHT
jgi:hypothetical protein